MQKGMSLCQFHQTSHQSIHQNTKWRSVDLHLWKEVEQAVRKVRASSSPGPNGVPYRVYKSASGVLWKLIKVAWEKQVVPRAWRRAGGVSNIAQRSSTYLLKKWHN